MTTVLIIITVLCLYFFHVCRYFKLLGPLWPPSLWACVIFIFADSSGNRPSFCYLRSWSYTNNPGLVTCSIFTELICTESHLKSKVGHILDKVTTLRINLDIDGVPITSHSHTHPSHSQFGFSNLSSPIHFPLLRSPLPLIHLVCLRVLDLPVLSFLSRFKP